MWRSIRAIAVVYLALLSGIGFGAYIMHAKTWPYPLTFSAPASNTCTPFVLMSTGP